MISTTLAVLALAGGFSPGTKPSLPGWQTDYTAAKAAAAAQHKPMAVFIGQGAESLDKMLADGTIPADAAKVLRDSYVCVYLETGSEAARELAGRFDLTTGLVINTEGGSVQAVRVGGAVAGPGLTQELARCATAQPAAVTVVSQATPAAMVGAPVTAGVTYPAAVGGPMIVTGGCANGRCGTPAYTFPSQPVFVGGGCANGRCGR
jgi:hypothetical protein